MADQRASAMDADSARIRELIEQAQAQPGVADALPVLHAWWSIESELQRLRPMRPAPSVHIGVSSSGP